MYREISLQERALRYHFVRASLVLREFRRSSRPAYWDHYAVSSYHSNTHEPWPPCEECWQYARQTFAMPYRQVRRVPGYLKALEPNAKWFADRRTYAGRTYDVLRHVLTVVP